MSATSNIEWTDATWNPIAGCSKLTSGCANCYALRMSHRIASMEKHPGRYNGIVRATPRGAAWTGLVNVDWAEIDKPLRWQKPRMVFACSMSDLFYEGVSDVVIDQVFGIMTLAQQHTFQILTKRSSRMRRWFENLPENPTSQFRGALAARWGLWDERLQNKLIDQWTWPLPNVWIGVTVENQECADRRVPDLLSVPAAVRYVSAEPLLGPLNLSRIKDHGADDNALTGERRMAPYCYADGGPRLSWVIVGGESGPNARLMRESWLRGVLRDCQKASVPVFVKQMGTAWARDHELHGKASSPKQWPDDLRVREWPT